MIPIRTFIFLLIVTIILAIVAGVQYPKKIQQPAKNAAIVSPTAAQTTLTLKPNPVYASTGLQSALNVQINTKKNKITAVQLELSYNPALLKRMSIVPGSFLGEKVELIKNIDESSGRITYALGIPPGTEGKKGKGTVATIVFSIDTAEKLLTDFKFLSKTVVSAENVTQSVLKSTQDTRVYINIPNLDENNH